MSTRQGRDLRTIRRLGKGGYAVFFQTDEVCRQQVQGMGIERSQQHAHMPGIPMGGAVSLHGKHTIADGKPTCQLVFTRQEL